MADASGSARRCAHANSNQVDDGQNPADCGSALLHRISCERPTPPRGPLRRGLAAGGRRSTVVVSSRLNPGHCRVRGVGSGCRRVRGVPLALRRFGASTPGAARGRPGRVSRPLSGCEGSDRYRRSMGPASPTPYPLHQRGQSRGRRAVGAFARPTRLLQGVVAIRQRLARMDRQLPAPGSQRRRGQFSRLACRGGRKDRVTRSHDARARIHHRA
jgi:hypothetical protein